MNIAQLNSKKSGCQVEVTDRQTLLVVFSFDKSSAAILLNICRWIKYL
ncbi:MAG: hypothetical protein OFPI_21840 [Osedax symbiont Rs2]|nr:MAG: hypothetical protein OFPI_21840 [Osedax symbiont Rs2]